MPRASAQRAQAPAGIALDAVTIEDINAAFDAGTLTSERLVERYLARIEAYDDRGPRLNSVIHLNPDALATAARLDTERRVSGPRSPLHGIPVLLKDNIDTRDMPTTAGSVTLAGSTPREDAFVVQRLRAAGAVILGKVSLSEFATPAGRGAYSSLSGVTRNPFDLGRDPAGSSGGTGASIAATFAAVGLGTDTGGSIRGPAAANGLVGIRPTLGLVSRRGIVPQAPSLDTAGPMSRNVTDAAIVLGILAGADPGDPPTLQSVGRSHDDYTRFLDRGALRGARIGIAREFFGGDPAIDALVDAAIETMKSLGATVVDPVLLGPGLLRHMSGLRARLNAEFQPHLEAYLATLADGFPRTLAEVLAVSESPAVTGSPTPVNPGLIATHRRNLEIGGLDGPDYLDAVSRGLPRVRSAMTEIFDADELDALVYPTARCPAQPLFTEENSSVVCPPGPSGVSIASYAGLPDIQVPAGFTIDGLPTTVSFVGRAYAEPTILGFAYAYEQASRHWRPPPSVPPLPGEAVSP